MRSRSDQGFTIVELTMSLLVLALLAGAAAPMVVSTLGAHKRDAAARQVVGAIRQTQSLAVTRNAVFGFQWGGDSLALRPRDEFRIVRDLSGACSLPAVSATQDGNNVLRDWSSLGDEYTGVTIQSIVDSSKKSLGGVMFNYMGASANTCTTVSFPITLTISDGSGRTRAIQIENTGNTSIL